MFFRSLLLLGVLAPAIALAGDAQKPTGDGVIQIYSSRHYDSDRELLTRFTAETGIKTELLEANADQIMDRLQQEGRLSPADIVITADVGRLWRLENAGLLQPISNAAILERIPTQYRAADNSWIGLTKRVRGIAASKNLSNPPSRMAELADPKWQGKLCVRSSNHVYNQSLLASMIIHQGIDAATNWAKGVANNLAQPPQGGDTDQMRSIAAGMCELAIVNSYYYARLSDSDKPDDKEVVEKVTFIFPDQDNIGAHTNISGAGIARHAKDRELGEKLLAFLVSDDAQAAFANGNYEYPVVSGVASSGIVAKLGNPKLDMLSSEDIGRNNIEALKIMDKAGWR